MRPTTRRELIVAATATAMTAAVPPAYGRLVSRRVGIGPGRFADGVASGEPTATAVTFWSRIRTERPRSGARLIVARDAGLDDVVAVAKVPTGPGVDHTLRTRVGGLEPATEYYYAWQSSTHVSEVGRTRTVPPADSATPLRIAFSSCQQYPRGFFTPHVDAAAQDLDLYLFLGDYVYEGGRAPAGAVRADNVDAVDLRTYRRKYRIYRTDPGLRELHRLHPAAHIWDDHEVFNNYTSNDPAPAPAQRMAGYRAAFEWLPRMVQRTDRYKLYRRVRLGTMADLFLLDARQYRSGNRDGRPRSMLGESQMRWLIRGLKASKATWKVVAQQVVMSQDPYGTGDSFDQWDGFAADRARLLTELERAGVRNVVVLTGDAHVFMCNLLGSDFAAVARDRNRLPAAVEYVGGSVTSPGRDVAESEVKLYAPWCQQFNGRDHGYALMALDGANVVTEYRRSDISSQAGGTVAFERFTQPVGLNRVARERLVASTST